METPSRSWHRTDAAVVAALLLYVAAVHAADTLAAAGSHWTIDWTRLRWVTRGGFDLFKFFAWFLIPFVALLALGRIDWAYFGVKRWRRLDAFILAGVAAAGLAAVLSIQVFPSLQDWYHGWGGLPNEQKWRLAENYLVWTLSWIVGWEFLHRYALLTQLSRLWPRYGWLGVPVVEGLYHLQKAPIEAAAMVVFGLLLTWWARARRNTILPFLAHLTVELELGAFLLVSRS